VSHIQKYIGITDFTSPDQVRQILRVPFDRGYELKIAHALGVGVMMSYKTLNDIPTKWSAAFPPKDSIAEIFIKDEDVFNVLHYADYDGLTTTRDIESAITFGGENMHALQLDMPWPSVKMVASVKYNTDFRYKIILQIGARAMEEVGNSPSEVVRRLLEYDIDSGVDYVLLDKSGGQGKGMDAQLLLEYYRAIREKFSKDKLGIVVAGGLGPTSVGLMQPFRDAHLTLDISCDAQGKLRPSGNALDPIDWPMAEEYYAQASIFFGAF
jgi:hypothetical protein